MDDSGFRFCGASGCGVRYDGGTADSPCPRCGWDPTDTLRNERDAWEAAARHFWDNGTTCPCGARPGSPNTHSHVMGCPVGAVLGVTVADLYRKAVEG